jgi:hypothetical protein
MKVLRPSYLVVDDDVSEHKMIGATVSGDVSFSLVNQPFLSCSHTIYDRPSLPIPLMQKLKTDVKNNGILAQLKKYTVRTHGA